MVSSTNGENLAFMLVLIVASQGDALQFVVEPMVTGEEQSMSL